MRGFHNTLSRPFLENVSTIKKQNRGQLLCVCHCNLESDNIKWRVESCHKMLDFFFYVASYVANPDSHQKLTLISY